MKLQIKSTTRLNPLGMVGASLFVGAPLVGAFYSWRTYQDIARTLRYRPAFEADISSIYWSVVICAAISMLGLVLFAIGREFIHDVEIDRAQE